MRSDETSNNLHLDSLEQDTLSDKNENNADDQEYLPASL